MINLGMIPRLQTLWAQADAAFRADDAYVLDVCDEIVEIDARRERARRRAAAATTKSAAQAP